MHERYKFQRKIYQKICIQKNVSQVTDVEGTPQKKLLELEEILSREMQENEKSVSISLKITFILLAICNKH